MDRYVFGLYDKATFSVKNGGRTVSTFGNIWAYSAAAQGVTHRGCNADQARSTDGKVAGARRRPIAHLTVEGHHMRSKMMCDMGPREARQPCAMTMVVSASTTTSPAAHVAATRSESIRLGLMSVAFAADEARAAARTATTSIARSGQE
jgi:hypothetical protein